VIFKTFFLSNQFLRKKKISLSAVRQTVLETTKGLESSTLSQNYSSRDITRKTYKVIRTITNVLTTLDAIFAIKTYVNEVVLV
jgi:hypothetical protein